MIRFSLLPASLVLAGLGIQAARAQVSVDHAWSRATPPHVTTGVLYLTLTSPIADRLVGITTPMAQTAELHQTEMTGTMSQMRGMDGGLVLPAGKPVSLSPGGYHVMLMGLKAPLKAGESLPVHLTFQTAPPVDVVAQVRALGAVAGPAMAGMPKG